MDFEDQRILVIGCGGIGCELLKLLSREKFRSITLIDYDEVDLSNLNRQFLFIKADIGRKKAMVAAEMFRRMNRDCDVFPICANILEFDSRFFAEYMLVYSCLDNMEARVHVNQRCFISKTPLVDGGSGGFKGQAYYFDYFSECFDCIPKRVSKEHLVCTVRSRPTNFEHCIVWARNVFFEIRFDSPVGNEEEYYNTHMKKLVENCSDMSTQDELNRFRDSAEYRDRVVKIVQLLKTCDFSFFNKDDRNTMEYVYNVAYIRARCAGIKPMSFDDGVTIAGKIVPAISTTNSIVAALMIHAVKNGCNYYSVSNKRVISRVETCERNPRCHTCSHDWYGVLYMKTLNIKELIKCFKRAEFELEAYTDDKTFVTRDMEDVDEQIVFRHDTVGEAICTGEGGVRSRIKLYFMSHGEELYFGRIYKATPRDVPLDEAKTRN